MFPDIVSVGITAAIFTILIICIILYYSRRLSTEERVTFEEGLYVLGVVISVIREKYSQDIIGVSKKFAVLQPDGSISPPNNSVKEYHNMKEEIRAKRTKQIMTSISPKVRKRLLLYYSSNGLINYILNELDKDK